MSDKVVQIDYTNYRGERSWRGVIPRGIYWGKSEHHQDWQWLMEAWDVQKGDWRHFAMKDVHEWKT